MVTPNNLARACGLIDQNSGMRTNPVTEDKHRARELFLRLSS